MFGNLAKGLAKKIKIAEDEKPFTTEGVAFPEPMPDKIMGMSTILAALPAPSTFDHSN